MDAFNLKLFIRVSGFRKAGSITPIEGKKFRPLGRRAMEQAWGEGDLLIGPFYTSGDASRAVAQLAAKARTSIPATSKDPATQAMLYARLETALRRVAEQIYNDVDEGHISEPDSDDDKAIFSDTVHVSWFSRPVIRHGRF